LAGGTEAIDDTVDVSPESDHKKETDNIPSQKTLKKMSPFTKLFADAINDDVHENQKTPDQRQFPKNLFFSPKSFKVIQSLVHLIPLWSCMLIRTLQKRKFVSDNLTCGSFTNGAVEAHFRTVKQGTLQGKKRVRPQQFLNQNLTYVKGKVSEAKFPQNIRLKVGTGERLIDDEVEKWNRSKSKTSGKYASSKTAEAIVKKIESKRKQKQTDDKFPDLTTDVNNTDGHCGTSDFIRRTVPEDAEHTIQKSKKRSQKINQAKTVS